MAMDYLAGNFTDVIEWINYHTLVGIDHFVILDNTGTQELATLVKPFTDHGVLELVKVVCQNTSRCWPDCRPQCLSAAFFLKNADWGGQLSARILRDTFWVSLSDLDEFFTPVARTLVDTIVPVTPCARDPDSKKALPALGSIMFSYQANFGPNGHELRPDKYVVEAYTTRQVSACCNGKSIALTDALGGFPNPHGFKLQEGYTSARFLYWFWGQAFFADDGGGPEKALGGGFLRTPAVSRLDWQGSG
jgi:hypothetical protein